MSKYKATIGIEAHIELKNESKMFCCCRNGMGLEKTPNIHICPVCTGQPGALPVPNRKAIEFVQLAGLALNCNLAKNSKFDRKNYFYPDIPKGYQISQYDQPLCLDGMMKIPSFKSQSSKKIGIIRIHLEEDTGKLMHAKNADYSLVDFNRAGVPLMELVTEPDIESGAEARLFCQKLQQICRYLEISDADMEKGHMRCEVNLSLYRDGEDKLNGTKVEVKNINSFKFVEKAIDYEIKRQTEILEKGGKITQETRGYDSRRDITVSQRIKESAHDYRYFPEPDIPPLEFSEEYFAKLALDVPELPDAKKARLKEQYGLSEENIEIITSERDLSEYFENVISELDEKIKSGEIAAVREKCVKLIANYMSSELKKHLVERKQKISEIKITPENYAEFIGILADGKINSSAAQSLLAEMYGTGGNPSRIVREKNLSQINDERELEKIIREIIGKNPKSAEDYKQGKQNALQFLVGQAMAATKGKANPKIAAELLKKNL